MAVQRAYGCGGGRRVCRCGGLPWGYVPSAVDSYYSSGRAHEVAAFVALTRKAQVARTREIHVFYEAWALGEFNDRELWPVVYKNVTGVDSLAAAIFKEFELPGGSKLLMQIGKYWHPFHTVDELPDGEIWVAVKDPESPKIMKEDSSNSSGDNEQESPVNQKKKTRRGTKAGRQVKERRIKATQKREAKAMAALATPAFNAPPPPPFGYMAPAMKGPCSFYVEMEQTPEGVATLPEGLVADA